MRIGIIGRGMVGNALYKGFKTLSHEMSFFDPKFENSKINDVIDTEIVFIAVPTIVNEEGIYDLAPLYQTLDNLTDLKYQGAICIKSTIVPGTTQTLIQKYENNKICFCPEFLKERSAYQDFMENNPICIVGTELDFVYQIVKKAHSSICRTYKQVSPTEAELTKFMQNLYNTYRILFANAFYEVCKFNDVEYNSILSSLLERNEMDDKYMKCDTKLRGPSGPCLVKDTLAFTKYVEGLDLDIKLNIFKTMVGDMKLYPKTVIEGTRSELEYFGKNLI